MKHRYAPKYRPPGITLPCGWNLVERPSVVWCFERRTDLPLSRETFGVIEYDRPLTDEEIRDYELKPV